GGRGGRDTENDVAATQTDLVVPRRPEVARAPGHPGKDVVLGRRALASRHEPDLVGTDRQDYRGAGLEPGERDAKPQGAAGDHSRLLRDAVHEVGLADELGDEPCLRTLEEVFGGPDLDDTASEEDGDSVRDDHRLRLVVRDVEGRDREGLVKPTDLEAHF